ncbi:hypothetical protein LWI29_027041 [Acer saccharum]|uniref:Uncharacterized protein n=1 Tax=Acer saccharum TaxID=4024 RepID=A0AA39WAU0_ACESA|nr:hypothetical protein LWI29_027041 [Acer saccharum]
MTNKADVSEKKILCSLHSFSPICRRRRVTSKSQPEKSESSCSSLRNSLSEIWVVPSLKQACTVELESLVSGDATRRGECTAVEEREPL